MSSGEFNVAWLSLTYRCNSKCVWCYAASNNYEFMKDKMLDFNKEEGIVRLLTDLKVPRIIFIGGEPTLYGNIADFADKLNSAGIITGMVSNGRKFRDRTFTDSLRRNGLNSVTFSIEGSCAKIHDETSQVNGSYDQVMSGLENALAAGIKVSSNTVISTKNVQDLERTVDSLAGKGLQSMSFNINGVCVSNEQNNAYMISPSEAIRAFEKVYLHAKSRGIKARLVTPMPLCRFSPELIEELKADGAIGRTPCQVVHGRNFVLDYNGDIVPCTHLTGYSFFNAFKEEGVMTGEEFMVEYASGDSKKFREGMNRYASSKCEGCKEPCAGGCPLFWIKYDPEVEIVGKN